ncbi:hypothetical protein SBRY_40058 [Actinacidiphila bryophytorum]|uniref:Uncharacterized protein n=1 Tax=Actinacidiphila bryophytorum TaxID=1436133 RepID=A0A9W4H251_9ACTN|nr:hypothetical protein SBRY_40058 [Actinacidiphila bryophytorum]
MGPGRLLLPSPAKKEKGQRLGMKVADRCGRLHAEPNPALNTALAEQLVPHPAQTKLPWNANAQASPVQV